MDETQREVDEIRKERSEVENHLIDEYSAGRISRRDFVRRGTIIGMSIPVVALLAAACGGAGDEPSGDTGGAGNRAAARRPQPAGGTFKFGLTTPAGTLNPVTCRDQGGLCLNGSDGRVPLATRSASRSSTPQLAESWRAERRRDASGRSRSARASRSTTKPRRR